MGKRKALSEFQTRLTGRIHSTDQEAVQTTAHWLAVEIEGRNFLFPLGQAGEISAWVEPQPVPYTRSWFLGVVNLRGVLCGVVSLAKYLDIEVSMSNQAQKTMVRDIAQERRLIGFHTSFDLNTVLVVDRLVGLKDRKQMTPLDVNAQCLDQQGQVWQEINLHALATSPLFINIAK